MGSRLDQKSNLVRKRIENHAFDGENGEEYEGSAFGGFSDYFRRKKIKLQNLDAELRSQSSDKPQIFKGIVCHINGYTQPSLNDLHTMIVQHGGGFIQYLDGKTMATHIIASNLTPKKKEEFKRYRIVKPAWIVDSIKASRALPWDNYRVVDEGVGQKVLGFQGGQMVSQASKKPQGYREQSDTSWYTSQLQPTAPNQGQDTAKESLLPTRTMKPSEEIEDEYPMEITSSDERAMYEADPNFANEQAPAFNVQTETPPPSSPPVKAFSKPHLQAGPSKVPDVEKKQDEAENTELRARVGSQEPDYSMAIVRESEILNAVSPERLAKMTAEEHNALLLSDPRIRKSTVVNPGFLEQYYRESRLHHLSTWKADLKSQLQALAADKSAAGKSRKARVPGQRRYIMHVDFDSFFAAISLKKHPEYQDKPAVVAHGGGSGSEIASCNYPARKFGIHNGMWMKRAQQLCPEVKVLPYDFPGYEDASRKFYDAILSTGGVVQSVSIDEALIDITSICLTESGSDGVRRSEASVNREQSKAEELGEHLRAEVLQQTGCAVSVGIGANILQAKVALRKAKPAGQFLLKPEEVLEFIGQLEVQKLPGVAWSIGGKLEEIGIKFVKDIREVTKEKLVNTLGPKTGEKIWEYARGIDRTEVGDQVVRKSVSAEVNWGVRFENQEQVDEFMHGICCELHKRLMKERVRGKQLTMKVMRRAADAPLDPPKHLGHGRCDTFNKSIQLGVSTNDAAVITKDAIAMLKSFNISPGELRGIGVQMQKLEPVRAGSDGASITSQRKLPFKAPDQLKVKRAEDPIQDDVRTPEKPEGRQNGQHELRPEPVGLKTPSKKPLNTTGTQFVLPTQVDPSVFAELPEDIRSRFAKRLIPSVHGINETKSGSDTSRPPSRPPSRGASPAVALPNQSQLDPEILKALPEDVRAEVLGHYQPGGRRGDQSLLPQSPRINRTIPPSRTALKSQHKKRGGGTLFAGRARSRLKGEGSTTLTQSNFVARAADRHLTEDGGAATTDTEADPIDLDPEFLAALPEDLRQEVLDQQRRARLNRTGGIDISNRRKKQPAPAATRPLDRHLQLPARPPKPTFTSRKLTELPELREAVKAWIEAFSDEGPYDEDVDALAKYLSAVVTDERDMEKAVSVANWMSWVIEENEDNVAEDIHDAWNRALDTVKAQVHEAVGKRGLGRAVLE